MQATPAVSSLDDDNALLIVITRNGGYNTPQLAGIAGYTLADMKSALVRLTNRGEVERRQLKHVPIEETSKWFWFITPAGKQKARETYELRELLS